MERFKLFITNFIFYGLGSVIGKFIPFIMIPIITRIMPNTEYMGLYDISTVIVSFAAALSLFGMYDAMFRMFFDQDNLEYQRGICSSALLFTCILSSVIFLFLTINSKLISEMIFSDRKLYYLLLISATTALFGSTNSIVSAPTRIKNQRKRYLILNLLAPILSYAISIPLLLNGYYIIALPIAALLSGIGVEFIFVLLNKKWFSIKYIQFRYIKDMLKIAVPLVPNFLIYWVFNSSDKLMLSKMLGNDIVGVYSVGSKIGQMSQLIYAAFAGGWQYFAFSTMNDDDQVELTSKVFEGLAAITFIASILLTMFYKPAYEIIFPKEYWDGSIVVPYLFLAPLLLMLYQVACNQFIIIKKTWPNIIILSIGAITNIYINLKLIPILGMEGASVATLLGYIISIIIVVVVLKKMNLFILSKRLPILTGIFVGYFVIWRMVFIDKFILGIIVGILAIIVIVFIFRKEIKSILKKRGKNYENHV